MRTFIPLFLLAACGPQTPVECSVDSQCGLGFRCQANQCVSAPTSPAPNTPSAPQAVSNDTCETATVATVGVTRGTTRGAKRDYSPMGCYQPSGTRVPTGGEVVFRFRPQPYSNLKFSVRSLSPDFTPAFYLTTGFPNCARAIEEQNCGSTPLAQTSRETPDVLILVGSTSATDGDFELTIEATPQQSNQGGGSAGGGSSAGGTAGGSAGGSVGGGSAGGTVQPAVTARAVFESQSDVREVSKNVRDYHLGVIRTWTGIARQTAGSATQVLSGTLTETAPQVYRYSATPTDRLQVNALNGTQFSITVQNLVGNLASAQFPGPDESISFIFRNYAGSLTGRIGQRGSPANGNGATRELSFQGISWTSETDTEISNLNIQSDELVSIGQGAASIRTETGSVTNTKRNISWSLRDDAWANCSICTPTIGSKFTPTVTTTVGGRTFVLEYEYEFGTAANAVMGRHLWSGTVKERGQLVGGFSRALVSGTTYSMNMSLGSDSYSTRVVSSHP
jgi:Cys-rich repeat protein